jgi:hypothetical protein
VELRLLEENIRSTAQDSRTGNDFLGRIPKEQETETEIDKLHYMKVKDMHNKGNNQWSTETAYRKGGNICQLFI